MKTLESLFTYKITKLYKPKLKKFLKGYPIKILERFDDYFEQKFTNQKSVKEAIAFFRKLIFAENYQVLSDIEDELTLIIENFKFFKSKRGKYIIYINQYVPTIYKIIRKNKAYKDLIIGGHDRKQIIFVVGFLKNKRDLNFLKKLIKLNPPTIPVEYKVSLKKS